jgi:hypothetical protein
LVASVVGQEAAEGDANSEDTEPGETERFAARMAKGFVVGGGRWEMGDGSEGCWQVQNVWG